MAERDDAGEAEHEVERDGEEREDGDLVEQQPMPWQGQQGGERQHPGQRLEREPQPRGGAVRGRDGSAHRDARGAKRPCGLAIRTATITP